MLRLMTVVLAVLAWAMLAVAPASAADKVVLMLNWYVYGEHAPFYYGKAKGIYAAENIDLEIQEGRGSAATTQAVAAKTADFGYVDVPTMMRAAVKGAPVVATGVLLQTSPMGGKIDTLTQGFELTVPLYRTPETKGKRPFQVTDQNMTDTVNLMVEYGGLEAKAKDNPKAFYTNDYLPK